MECVLTAEENKMNEEFNLCFSIILKLNQLSFRYSNSAIELHFTNNTGDRLHDNNQNVQTILHVHPRWHLQFFTKFSVNLYKMLCKKKYQTDFSFPFCRNLSPTSLPKQNLSKTDHRIELNQRRVESDTIRSTNPLNRIRMSFKHESLAKPITQISDVYYECGNKYQVEIWTSCSNNENFDWSNLMETFWL